MFGKSAHRCKCAWGSLHVFTLHCLYNSGSIAIIICVSIVIIIIVIMAARVLSNLTTRALIR